MKLVFDLDGVICTPPKGIQYGVVTWIDKCKPIANAIEFMQWLKNEEHEIVIWCKRPNDLAVKFATEQWLELHQVPYDRLIFDRPGDYINVEEPPSHAKFYKHIGDLGIVAEMYEEWKNDKTKGKENKH